MRVIARCATAVLTIGALGLASLTSSADEAIVRLESEDLLIEFDVGAFGGAHSIVDKETGVEFRSDKSAPAALFRFTRVLPSGRTASYSNRDARTVEYELVEEGSQQTLHLRFNDVGSDGLNVLCTITAAASSGVEWYIEITGGQQFRLRDVTYPCFSGMSGISGDSRDDWLVYPLEEGLVIPDYQSAIGKWGSWSWTSLFVYPGDLSMQFMAQYDDDAGLLLAALDSGGTAKRFEFLGRSANDRWQIVTQTSEESRRAYRQAYPAILKVFHGDWYAAAEIYRGWAADQLWCSTPVLEDMAIPDWFLTGEPVLRFDNYSEYPGHPLTRYYALEDVAESALAFRRELNTALTVRLIGWEQHDIWDNPHSLPPRDGIAGFTSMLNSLHAQGNRLELVRSVMRWTDSSPGFLDAISFAVRESSGSAFSSTIPLFDREMERMAMCPATDFWRAVVEENARETASLGVDLLALDEAPIGLYPQSCFASDHGHELGSGTWWAEATYSLLELARDAAKAANPNILCPTESPSEFYIPVSDSYVARRTFPDRSHYKHQMESFPGVLFPPVFQFVYHEYVVPYTEPYMDHEWAFENPRYIPVSQSIALISGQILGLRAQWFSALGATREWLESTRKHVEMWQSCGREFLAYGEMQRPPDLNVPLVEIESLNEAFADSPLCYPAVLASAWTSPFGATGYFFSNISEDQVDIAPELAGFDVLDGRTTVLSIWRNSQPEEILAPSTSQAVPLSLAPGDLLVIRLSAPPTEDSTLAPEVALHFNETARVVEFSAEIVNDSGAPTGESYLVVESTEIDLPHGGVYRSIPGLAPNQRWSTTGQLTVPWDYFGDLGLSIRCLQLAGTEESHWEWVETWSSQRTMRVPLEGISYSGRECYAIREDASAVSALRVDGLEPAASHARSPEWSFWIETPTSEASRTLRPETSSGQRVIIATNPADAKESVITMEFRSAFDASQYDGIEVVMQSADALPVGVQIAFPDCGIQVGDRCGWNTGSTSCNLQTSEQPQRYQIPFSALSVPPWILRKYPDASSTLELASVRALQFVIEAGLGTPGTILVHEVAFYKDLE